MLNNTHNRYPKIAATALVASLAMAGAAKVSNDFSKPSQSPAQTGQIEKAPINNPNQVINQAEKQAKEITSLRGLTAIYISKLSGMKLFDAVTAVQGEVIDLSNTLGVSDITIFESMVPKEAREAFQTKYVDFTSDPKSWISPECLNPYATQEANGSIIEVVVPLRADSILTT
jgi:hypothetical protein